MAHTSLHTALPGSVEQVIMPSEKVASLPRFYKRFGLPHACSFPHSLLVVAVAVRPAARKGILAGKDRPGFLRHGVVVGAHGGHNVLYPQLRKQVADAAVVKHRVKAVQRRPRRVHKAPGIWIGRSAAPLRGIRQIGLVFRGVVIAAL